MSLSSGRVLVGMVQLGGVLPFLYSSRPGSRKDSPPLLYQPRPFYQSTWQRLQW